MYLLRLTKSPDLIVRHTYHSGWEFKEVTSKLIVKSRRWNPSRDTVPSRISQV